ncbi:succinate dehydrogenase cytochrome b subunit [Galbibacter sp. BG1]|uniref:succinate dehydrogenase cytochrome b subunit n=1 Tax=Galbibacter sp. BG1 TaxID=1170699 RepID=UPI0015C14237|nr:succinate dehydrogenase cytochrome b subunit [Galbibacter sp. BG1]QLE01217.1 succinate dehydrogenase cytochrome b subunit [Galbibacter sp. BG1]
MSGMLNSTIARKVAMSLSALFLLIFLLQHFIINFTSVISESTFNELSHFMGTNVLVQFLMQPILIFAVVFHFVMGFVLEIKNKKARDISYVSYNGNANSSWMSRNMIYSGLVILAFLALHFIDFWLPEMNYKYVQFNPEDPTRYYHELVEKFHNPIRVGAYVIAFVLLALHLLHGFQSAFQSIGVSNKFNSTLKAIGKFYAIFIPLGFIFIALFHFFNH